MNPEPLQGHNGNRNGDMVEGVEAESILELAHKYDMADLKEVLEAYLAKSLNSGNVVRRALLADEYSAGELKKVGGFEVL
jgi:hypothetical protein